MIRITLISLIIAGLSLYAFRDWYKSLCGLIIFMSILLHPDIRGSMLGIQGFNLFNILFIFVVIGWISNRGAECLTWDMPFHVNILLLIYALVIVVSFSRGLENFNMLQEAFGRDYKIPSTAYLLSENLINSIKWAVPGLLLFDGCRSRSRFIWGVSALLILYFILSLQVIKLMPLSAIASGIELSQRSAKVLLNDVGYSRVNMSTMLAGASWAIFATIILVKQKGYALLLSLAGITVLFAQILTGGRAGYVAWAVVGLIISLIRWRKLLIIMPVVVILLISIIPGVSERISRGFTADTMDYNPLVQDSSSFSGDEFNWYTITSGRNVAWPYVTEKIEESPLVGYGMQGMQTTGIMTELQEEFEEDFSHPHNAYLEFILDNGFSGFIPIILFYFIVLKSSVSLLCDYRNPAFVAIGGLAFSLVGAFIVGSFGSQTFYPREGAVGMWCAIGLMFRVYVDRFHAASIGGTSDAITKYFSTTDGQEGLKDGGS